ncbi:hypothetical protein IWW49_002240, partial [Coemansia sp. RSA 1797]
TQTRAARRKCQQRAERRASKQNHQRCLGSARSRFDLPEQPSSQPAPKRGAEHRHYSIC